jgi:hypothetical protein
MSFATCDREATQAQAHFQLNPPVAVLWANFRIARSTSITMDTGASLAP